MNGIDELLEALAKEEKISPREYLAFVIGQLSSSEDSADEKNRVLHIAGKLVDIDPEGCNRYFRYLLEYIESIEKQLGI